MHACMQKKPKKTGENLLGIVTDNAEHSNTKTGSIRLPYFKTFTTVGSQGLKNIIVLVASGSLTPNTVHILLISSILRKLSRK